jgi:hypothetical protein
MTQVPIYHGHARKRRKAVVGWALVSDDDASLVRGYCWHLKVNRSGILYAVAYGPYDADGKRKVVRMHRLVAGLGDDDPREPDHIDGNGLNNQRFNLRIATHAQNQQNRHGGRGSSRHRGVSWDRDRGKWKAAVGLDGRTHNLGRFDDEAAAADAAANFRAAHMPYSQEAAELTRSTR